MARPAGLERATPGLEGKVGTVPRRSKMRSFKKPVEGFSKG